jgi:hypothetical protein
MAEAIAPLPHLVEAQSAPRLRIAAHLGCGEGVEAGALGRMHPHQLALQMRGKSVIATPASRQVPAMPSQ